MDFVTTIFVAALLVAAIYVAAGFSLRCFDRCRQLIPQAEACGYQ
jgi:hypothetical protein